MKFLTHSAEHTETKWLSFKGQVGEVNNSVLELYEKKQAEQKELSAEQIVTEAKQLAMSEMPDEVEDLVTNLKNRFKKPGDLKKEKTVEAAKKTVREMVFAVLDEGASRYNSWGSNLEELVDDVQNDENDAILTIKDTQRSVNTVENILSQYKRQAGILAEQQGKTNKIKRKGFLWLKKEDISGTSERSLYDGFSKIAESEISIVLDKFKAKASQAETIHRENKDLIESGFKALSPDEKAEFIKRADEEVRAGKDKFKTGLTAKWKAVGSVVAGVDVLQRVEIFPELLEPGKANLLQASSDKVDLERKRFEQRESFIQGKAQLTFTQSNIDDVKTELTDVKPDTSFNEGGLNDLNQEITLFFRANSIDVSGLYKYGGKKLSPEQLNEYETFTILFQAIFDHKDKLTKAPKELKKKILAACGWLEGMSLPEGKEKPSTHFASSLKTVKTWNQEAQRLHKEVTDVKKADDITPKTTEDINKFIGGIKVLKQQLEKSELSENEKVKINDLLKELTSFSDSLETVLANWKTVKSNRGKADIEDKKAEYKAEQEKLKAEYNKKKAEHKAEQEKLKAKHKKDKAQLRLDNKNTKDREELTRQKDETEETLEGIKKELKSLKPKLTKLKKEASPHKDETEKLEDDLVELKRKQSGLKAVISKTDTEKKAIPNAVKAGLWSKEEGQAAMLSLQETQNNAISELATVEAEILNRTSKIKRLNRDFNDLKEDFDELKARISELERDEKKAEAEFKVAQKALASFTEKELDDDEGFVEEAFTDEFLEKPFEETSDYDLEFFGLDEDIYRLISSFGEISKLQSETITTKEEAIAAHFVYNSMRQNQDLYRERFTALQGEQFDILKGLTNGRGVDIKFTDYLHGTDLPDTMALNTAVNVSGAVILEKTDDAVVLLDGNYVVIVQKSAQHDKYQVLKLPAPAGFDGKTNLPPDFFPQNASLVGELIQLTPA